MQMLNSTHTLVSPTPTTLERYLLEFESSMSVSFVSEYSRKSSVFEAATVPLLHTEMFYDFCPFTFLIVKLNNV